MTRHGNSGVVRRRCIPSMPSGATQRRPEQIAIAICELIGGRQAGRYSVSEAVRVPRVAAGSSWPSINTWRGVHFVRGSTLELGPPAQDVPGVATRLEEVKLPSERSRQTMARFPAARVCLARWEVWT
jgi:hypothetical protein